MFSIFTTKSFKQDQIKGGFNMVDPGNEGQYQPDTAIKLTIGGANSQYQKTSTAMRTVREIEESHPETKPPRGKKNVHGYVEMTHHEKK